MGAQQLELYWEGTDIEPDYERPPKRVFPLERPFPRISENTVVDANSKRFISDTQVPGAAESLGRLARPQAVVRGFYKGREQKARLQKQMPGLQGFHWTA